MEQNRNARIFTIMKVMGVINLFQIKINCSNTLFHWLLLHVLTADLQRLSQASPATGPLLRGGALDPVGLLNFVAHDLGSSLFYQVLDFTDLFQSKIFHNTISSQHVFKDSKFSKLIFFASFPRASWILEQPSFKI